MTTTSDPAAPGHPLTPDPAPAKAAKVRKPKKPSSLPPARERRKQVILAKAGKVGLKDPERALLLLRRAYKTDPTDEDLVYRIARTMRTAGKLDDALAFLRKHQKAHSPRFSHDRRFLLDTRFDEGKWDEAEAVGRDLLATGSTKDQAWAKGRLMRIGLEQRAAALGLKPEQRPRLWWMASPYPGNFGDILNPYLVEKLSGLPPLHTTRGNRILAIGSIVKFAKAGTQVWGSGTPRMSDTLNPAAEYRAVRGPLTRQLVLSSKGACPEVYGDAAWFLPKIYRPAKGWTKRYRLGVIPHYSNMKDLKVADDVKLVSVLRGGYDEIEAFVDDIHECACILTTSLHGLIVAHAYGIPARWCQVPDAAVGPPGDGTKFHDYMLSVGLPAEPSLHIPRGTTIDVSWAAQADRLPRKQIDLTLLAAAAPFTVLPQFR